MPTTCGHHRDFGAALQSASDSVISSHEPNHQETASELIQAIALEGQTCHGKKRDTDQHRQLHSSFS
jgi:hypothetical protein